jgi:tyrosine-protein kinase Etk/Wzc
METKLTDLFDVLAVFARKRKLIIIFTLVVAISAIVYSLVTPQIWNSKATFFTVGDNAQALPIDLGSLSGLASSFLSTDNFAQGQNSMAILTSRTLSEEIIRKFKLIKYFRITDQDSLRAMDRALLKLSRKVFSVDLNDETGLMTLSINTKSRLLSRNIATYYIERLERYNQEYKLTKGKRNRQFLEKRVAEVKNQIDSLSIAMKDFQKRNKTIDLETQMASIVQLYSDVVSQQMKNDIELEIARNNYPSDSPVITELEQRRKVIQEKVRNFEKSATGVQPKYIINIDNIPDISLQYAQLMVNLEIQKKVFEFVYPQYEAARIEELKDMPTLEIVDYPREAGLRAKPKRAVLCIIATLIGLFLSLMLALITDVLDKNSEKIKNLRQIIFAKR